MPVKSSKNDDLINQEHTLPNMGMESSRNTHTNRPERLLEVCTVPKRYLSLMFKA